MFTALTDYGITARAGRQPGGHYLLRTWNPREFTTDPYRRVDDRPYGGGPGMVMCARPLEQAVHAAKAALAKEGVSAAVTILMSPQGKLLTHAKVMRLAASAGLILICGRYEGVDRRFIDRCVDEEISIGDFVLSGGEIPAMACLDAIIRQLPGVLHDPQSALEDSFVTAGLLDCPHYTRPQNYEGLEVPPVLLGGNHAEIRAWRHAQALTLTQKTRPDLYLTYSKN